jgi:hypothetical protein
LINGIIIKPSATVVVYTLKIEMVMGMPKFIAILPRANGHCYDIVCVLIGVFAKIVYIIT